MSNATKRWVCILTIKDVVLTALPEILRRSAESTLHQLVRIAFARLYDLDPIVEEQKLADGGETEAGEVKMSVSTSAALPSVAETESTTGESVSGNTTSEEVVPPPDSSLPPPETPSAPRPPCRCYHMRSNYSDSER